MRAILAGIIVASVYTLAIGILLSMTMPTRGQIEAYIDEARPPVAASVTPIATIDPRLAS